jgi:hypothetical protein
MTTGGMQDNPIASSLERIHLPDGKTGREEIDRINRRVRTFVAQKPVAAVLLALAAGYVVGRVVSRVG